MGLPVAVKIVFDFLFGGDDLGTAFGGVVHFLQKLFVQNAVRVYNNIIVIAGRLVGQDVFQARVQRVAFAFLPPHHVYPGAGFPGDGDGWVVRLLDDDVNVEILFGIGLSVKAFQQGGNGGAFVARRDDDGKIALGFCHQPGLAVAGIQPAPQARQVENETARHTDNINAKQKIKQLHGCPPFVRRAVLEND